MKTKSMIFAISISILIIASAWYFFPQYVGDPNLNDTIWYVDKIILPNGQVYENKFGYDTLNRSKFVDNATISNCDSSRAIRLSIDLVPKEKWFHKSIYYVNLINLSSETKYSNYYTINNSSLIKVPRRITYTMEYRCKILCNSINEVFLTEQMRNDTLSYSFSNSNNFLIFKNTHNVKIVYSKFLNYK